VTYTVQGLSQLANKLRPVEILVNTSSSGVATLRIDDSVRLDLERNVHMRTGRRIRNLRVELETERIVLRGLADSYYVKQLAQEGILDLLPEVCLLNAISVHRQSEMIA
jgi:hypothetical protein